MKGEKVGRLRHPPFQPSHLHTFKPLNPRVKICGLTRLEDARYCAAVGADYLGFVQHPASPRYVRPAAAREIIGWVTGPEPVGVFVDREADEVVAACREAGFRLAQLHGHEPPEACAAVEAAGIPVIKSFRVQHDASAEQLRALMEPYAGVARFVLLDTFHTSLWGGTGESFNWRLARELAADRPLFLAGGISAANVAEAVRMRPYALDLSSSLEENPGVKDFDKLAAFFDAFAEAVGR